MSESVEVMEPLSGIVREDEDAVCCECNVSYEDDGIGEEWVRCACKRWIHENCIDEVIVDINGEEYFCSFCIILVATSVVLLVGTFYVCFTYL